MEDCEYCANRHNDEAVNVVIRYIKPTAQRPDGYIGAQASWPPKAGESWRRGRDLTDGPATQATLEKIMRDIEQMVMRRPEALQ